MSEHLVVIGGGAAGFFCAVNAARLNPALKVTLVEKTGKILSKVKISGGGRCNITHACFDIVEMSKHFPRGNHFVRKTFYQFFTTDTIRWFEDRGVKLKKETDGRMFPVSDTSQTVLECLLKESKKYNVEIRMHREVIRILSENGKFSIECKDQENISARYVCIACGGFPKSYMYGWLRNLGHSIDEPVPSLFTFNIPGHPVTALKGISVPGVIVKIPGTKLVERGPLLITHWGLSGPAILKLSAWGAEELAAKNYNFKIVVNWVPECNEQQVSSIIQSTRTAMSLQKVINKNPFGLPNRLWSFLLESSGINNLSRWADLPLKNINLIIKNICAFSFEVKGKTTFKEEFVTAGGIKLKEIDHMTMMSKIVPNLFFAGEIMNVDGLTGGYNFQHAWTSGYIAAKSIAAAGQ